MIQYTVSTFELGVLEDIAEIGYGELYNVCLTSEPPQGHSVETITPNAGSLLKHLRAGIIFEKIVVHDSEPVTGEYKSLTENQRHCLKKIRFT